MLRRHSALWIAALAASSCVVTSAFAADNLGTAKPVDNPPAVADRGTDEVVYGPILSRDPVVRGQIKRLYQEQWQYNRDATARLAELAQQAANERDPDLRAAVELDGVELKKEMELRNASFGLDIATLNGQTERVAEFERAIDQMLHPENYRPAPVDPSVGEERARQLGLE